MGANFLDELLKASGGWGVPSVTQFDPMATDSRLGNGPQVEKEKNQLNALFQGAVFAGDLDKAARLAVTPEHQAMLDVAYGQRINDRDRRARQDAGYPVDAPTNLLANFQNAQYTNLMRGRAEEDRQAKIRTMNDASKLSQAHTKYYDAQTTNANAKDLAPPVKPIWDSERGVFVTPPTGGGAPGVATVPGIDAKDRPLTEFQGKAIAFGTRAANSHDIINSVGKGGDVQSNMLKRSVENTPVLGGALAMGANTLPGYLGGPSDEQNKVEQAQRDFVNATLRQESGAAIGLTEFANAKTQYFPQPGDEPGVIAQKAKNRQLVVDAFRAEAGPSGNKQIDAILAKNKTPQAAGGGRVELDNMPMAREYKGKQLTAPDGTKYVSDGERWVRR